MEDESDFEAYVARLQNIAGDRPLVLTEVGLDSRRHGRQSQTRSVAGQLRTAYELGAAGAFVFSWTDEWNRGGAEVEDWDFGVVDRGRRPKPVLAAVQAVFADPIGLSERSWPTVSVIVCSLNGERWIRGCLEALAALEYPNYEVVVVDDGSTDRTAAIAGEFDVRVISTSNGGLSRARNLGLAAADSEIVAFVDDDTRPEPSWLAHLVLELVAGTHVGVGGPNIAPPATELAGECVAGAPGGPIHVLVGDREAEHVPGCNMAFRAPMLRAAGGFDPVFRVAGDDVDLCWRLHDRGETIGFAASAMVWHHPRQSLRGYLLQQFRYGEAEALLERKWPERYNRRGQASWAGSVYGSSNAVARGRRRPRIHYGEWGAAPFQKRELAPRGRLFSVVLSPEWYLLLAALALLGALGTRWAPLLVAIPLLAVALPATVVQASLTATRVAVTRLPPSRGARPLRHIITVCLHMLQPAARLAGRVHLGLVPWRRRGSHSLRVPAARTHGAWSELWASPEQRLGDLEQTLAEAGDEARRGGAYDRWDLQVRGGAFGKARVRAGFEEHGQGRQLIRLRAWPVPSPGGVILAALLALLAIGAYGDGAQATGALLGALGLGLAAWCLHDCAVAIGAFRPATLERALARRHDVRSPAHEPLPDASAAPADELATPPGWVLSLLAPPEASGARAPGAAERTPAARSASPRSL